MKQSAVYGSVFFFSFLSEIVKNERQDLPETKATSKVCFFLKKNKRYLIYDYVTRRKLSHLSGCKLQLVGKLPRQKRRSDLYVWFYAPSLRPPLRRLYRYRDVVICSSWETSPTVTLKVDSCWETSGVVGVVQCAENGRLLFGHGDHHHQYRTQSVTLHHFHGFMEFL